MYNVYHVEIRDKLDVVQQIFKSMQVSLADATELVGIKRGTTIDYKDIHEKFEYNYDEFDKQFGRHLENMHLYNGFSFAKRGLDKQSRPEFFISGAGGGLGGEEMTTLSYTNYGMQDYINIVSRLKDKTHLRIPERVYRDFIYRQFLSFHLYDKVNPFDSPEEFFKFVTADVLSNITIVEESEDTWYFKTYAPVLKESANKRRLNEMHLNTGIDRLGISQKYLKIKNIDHFIFTYEAAIKNTEERYQMNDSLNDVLDVYGYYMSVYNTLAVEGSCKRPMISKEVINEKFKGNVFANIMDEFVRQTELSLVAQ